MPSPKLTMHIFLQLRSLKQVQLYFRFDMAHDLPLFYSLFQYTQQKEKCYWTTTARAEPLCTRTSAGSAVTWLLTPMGKPPQESRSRFNGYFNPE